MMNYATHPHSVNVEKTAIGSGRRIKDAARINTRSLGENTNPEYEFRYIDIGNVNQNGIIDEPEIVQFDAAPSRARRIVVQGDVIISTVRTYLKAVAYFNFKPENYIVSTGFAVLSHMKRVVPAFLSYYCQSDFFIDLVIKNSKGVSYPAINASELSALEFFCPPLKEQTAIANYLDAKTQTIDKKITLLEEKIGYYQELRKSLVQSVIFRGLEFSNKNYRLKDSGISYIEPIPEHWSVQRIKDQFYIGRGRVISQEELLHDGKYPVYSSQTENNGCLGFIATYDFDTDLLTWTTDGVNAGTVFKRSGKFSCTNVCGTLKPKKKNLDLGYTAYALHISASHNKRIDTNGAKIMNGEMAVIQIPFPPLHEQQKIASFLDAKLDTIAKITASIQAQVATLKELRKTLINDVVTGKIKVSHE
ncbi:MAG TPA: restriction endonuclease subunit S [Puia sp.]|nr:restriction endonuclease subunit S [Puia sp.]